MKYSRKGRPQLPAATPEEKQAALAAQQEWRAQAQAAMADEDFAGLTILCQDHHEAVTFSLLQKAAMTGRQDLVEMMVPLCHHNVQRSALFAVRASGSVLGVTTLVKGVGSRVQSGALKDLLKAGKQDLVSALLPHVTPRALKAALCRAAEVGHIGLIRQVFKQMDLSISTDMVAGTAARACLKNQREVLTLLLQHVNAEEVFDKIDAPREHLEAVDMLGCLADFTTQLSWLGRFPQGLPGTAEVVAARQRALGAGDVDPEQKVSRRRLQRT